MLTIVEGEGDITLEGKLKRYIAGQTIIIPQGVKHRIANNGTEKVLIEVQTGSYFGEDDIVRIEDDYNRKIDEKEKNNYSIRIF